MNCTKRCQPKKFEIIEFIMAYYKGYKRLLNLHPLGFGEAMTGLSDVFSLLLPSIPLVALLVLLGPPMH